MNVTLTGSVVAYLKEESSIVELVEDRIYAKQITAHRSMPAIAVNKTSQISAETHSGRVGVYTSTVRMFVFAEQLLIVENIKQAINDLLDGEQVELNGINANFALTNDADYDEYELLEAEEWAGVLEYECNWWYATT